MTEALGPDAVCARRDAFAVLDVRAEAAFRAGHLAGSGHLPRAEMRVRSSELPPRHEPLLVVADDAEQAAAAAAELEALGFARVGWLEAPLASLEGGLADRGPAARLWRPAPFLEEALARIPEAREGGAALDVAAGAGREAVYLALRGFEVEARDRDPDALARAAALAGRHGVRIATVLTDLEREGATLPSERFRLVVCFRYLHRPLFEQIEGALAPGGWLVYETYRLGQERYGRPRRGRFLLQPGELGSAFPTLAVVHYAELSPAGGPVTARLIARKPGAGRP
ncbi:MAG TPA: methyltransferase domain-containing protein [Candidatus Eisenbacteria bacterium]